MLRMILTAAALVAAAPDPGLTTTYYVRETVGNDANDGTAPDRAFRRAAALSGVMHAGDTAYVGPGLYREQIEVLNDGRADARITFIADTTGQHTGDPPGIVMLAGSEPVDESMFQADPDHPGVYTAKITAYTVWGVVEMDGTQARFLRAKQTKEHLVDGMSEVDVVGKLPSTWALDEQTHVVYVHTSDGQHPSNHEIEFMRRGAGISCSGGGKHYVTVVGFTFRNMQDAGIQFMRGSGDGVALDVTSWGSRQGIRVYGATNTFLYNNVLFRNENSGVYYAAESNHGVNVRNVTYENIKGIRWSSNSQFGVAMDNWAFDNHEKGISIENANFAILRRNHLAHNQMAQLLVNNSEYTSEDNCFENGSPEQLIADFYPFPIQERFKTLLDYQRARHQDLHSREGCGPLPPKVDVHKLHAESMAYAERARRILRGEAEATSTTEPPAAREGVLQRWYDWFTGSGQRSEAPPAPAAPPPAHGGGD